MNCIINNKQSQELLKNLHKEFPEIPEGVLINVINYSGRSMKENPITGEDSELYNEALIVTQNSSLAAQLAASVYSKSFITQFGDWLNRQLLPDKQLITYNNSVFPRILYQTSYGNYTCSNYFDALGIQMREVLDRRGIFQENQYILNRFVNLISDYKYNRSSVGDLGELFNIIKKFNDLGVFREIKPIKVGFGAVPNNLEIKFVRNGIAPSNRIEFREVATTSNVDFNSILRVFSNEKIYQGRNITTYNLLRNPDGSYKRIIDIRSGIIEIKDGITINNLKNARSSLLKYIYTTLQEKYPQYLGLYQKDYNRFLGFIRGIANSLVQGTKSPDKIVYDAIQFENSISSGFTSFIINNQFKDTQTQLFFDVPKRSNTSNQQLMQSLLSQVQDQTNIDQILTSIANSDQYFGELASSLIGRANVNIEYSDSNIQVFDNISGKFRETDGIYNPETNTITLSKSPYSYPPKLIIHEIMHALTYQSLHADKNIQNKANSILKEAQNLLFKKYKVKNIEELREINSGLAYALSSTDEFFSMLYTNSSFIKELNSVGTKKKLSILDRIKNFLLNILGISQVSDICSRASNLLEEIITTKNNYSPEELAEYKDKVPDELFQVVYNEEQITPAAPIKSEIIWNEQQQKAIDDISNLYIQSKKAGTRAVCRIIGKAGTGKTTVCPAIIEKIIQDTKSDPRIIIGAIANYAKNNLATKFPQKLGISAWSVAKMLGKTQTFQNGEEIWIPSKTKRNILEKKAPFIDLVVVDEASMLSDELMNDIETLYKNATIIYIGDKRQVRPVEKVYSPITPFIRREVDYSIELLERVRQGEGAPILDIADIYGDLSSGDSQPSNILQTIGQLRDYSKTPVTKETDTNAVYSVSSYNEAETIDALMPLVLEAINTEQLNKIEVIPYHISERDRYNKLIRKRVLSFLGVEDVSLLPEDENYIGDIPYQQGEIITLEQPLVEKDLDNGQKLIVDNVGTPSFFIVDTVNYTLSSANIDHIQKNLDRYNSSRYTILKVYSTPVKWTIKGDVEKTGTVNIITESGEEALKTLKKELIKNLYSYYGFNPVQALLDKLSEEIAIVRPGWALNVHKAQGQTYDVTYIPIEDYEHSIVEDQRRGEPEVNQLYKFTSQLYTAITRASNITILGRSNFQEKIPQDVQQKNWSIIDNKKFQRQIVKQELERIQDIDNTASIEATNIARPTDRVSERVQGIEDITPIEEPTIVRQPSIMVPPKFRKLYDFLLFVTGNEALYKSLASNNKDAQDKVKKLTELFFQRETELLKLGRTFGKVQFINGGYNFQEKIKHPSLLYRPITKDNIEEIESQFGEFQKIDSLEVKSAQAVIPKQYENIFKMGSKSLADINPQFFRKVNPYYWSKVEGTDFLVRTHTGNFNIAIYDTKTMSEQDLEKYGKPLNIEKDNLGYRLDNNGNRMYWLPKGATVYELEDANGIKSETIVLTVNNQRSSDTKTNIGRSIKNIFSSIQDDIVSIQPFINNISNKPLAVDLLRLAQKYTIFTTDEIKTVPLLAVLSGKINKGDLTLEQAKQELINYYQNNAKVYSNKLGKTLYNSFVKSCSITSSRIPTQALASFMDMQVTSYMPDGVNEVFVSRWQLWLQGSKYKIGTFKNLVNSGKLFRALITKYKQ